MKAIDIRWQHVLRDKIKKKNNNAQLKDKDYGINNEYRHKQKDNSKDRVS